jgi:hypothetical protein
MEEMREEVEEEIKQHAHLAFLQKQKETVGKMNLLLRLTKQQMTTLEKAQDLYSRYLAG